MSKTDRAPRLLPSQLHYGPPLFGYILALALVAVRTVLRLAISDVASIRLPFVTNYPAVMIASLVGGVGPGLAALVVSTIVVSILFSPALPLNWIALAILGPLLVMVAAHLRYIHERNKATAADLVRFKFISDHADDWILLLSEDGHLLYVNRKAAGDLGTTEDALLGRYFSSVVGPDQSGKLTSVLEMAKTGPVKPVEADFSGAGGSMLSMELQFTAVRAGEQDIIYAAARDITERKQIEKKLREIRYWESLGALSAGLSHDFNNLLTSILGNASLARNLVEPYSDISPLLDEIIAAAERSSDLVRMLLATSGYRSGVKERLDLTELVDEALARVRAPRNIRISKKIEPSIFVGDRRAFQTLLWCLLTNGIESHNGSAGEVTVEVRSAVAPALRNAAFVEGDTGDLRCLGIVVTDRGHGMSPDLLRRAFDPFFSTKFTGRGLGLPAIRGIVRAYSGRLSVRTAEGEGTAVEVWIPNPE